MTSSISVTIKTLDSQNHKFEGLSESMTVKELKDHISPVVGIPSQTQRLIYCGRVLQDDKKLSEYSVNEKVIHLVQRLPPTSSAAGGGPDRLAASEARARSRGSSPAPPRMATATRTHIHVHGGPPAAGVGQPSMLVRLNLARDMIDRANRVLDNLENLRQPGGATNTNSQQSSRGRSPPAAPQPPPQPHQPQSQEQTFNFHIEDAPNGLNINQVVQSAINTAMNSFAASSSNGGSSFQSLSYHVDRNGHITQQPEGESATNAGSGGVPRPSSAASSGPASTSRPSPHPRPPALVEVMRSYSDLSRRINPLWEELMTQLAEDESRSNAENVEQNQALFNRVTEAMHFMSHALHALSDGVINYQQAPPREVRARPFVIPSAVVQSMPIFMGPRRGSNSNPASSADVSNSANSTAPSAPPLQAGPAMEFNIPGVPAGVEVTMEPIVVGIEMGPEITINASGSDLGGGNPQDLQQMIQGVISNIIGGHVQAANVPGGPSPPSSSTSSTSTPSANSAAQSQDSQARGNTQTQPTTSTRTRTTTHVHYAPLGQFTLPGFPMPPPVPGPAFDPFLQCHSHHITNERGRGVRVARPQPRSSSVPPPAAPNQSGPEGGNRVPTSGMSSSARSTPLQSPARRMTATIDINLMPQFAGAGHFVRPHPMAHLQQQASQATEPGLFNLIQQLAGGVTPTGNDAGMVNVIQSILREITGILSNEFTGQPSTQGGQSVAQFLRTMPDYSYTPGESLIVDVLMAMASVLTLRDVVHIVIGNSNGLSRIQTPLREFLRTRIMNGGSTSLEAGLKKLLDENFSTFEEVAGVATVREDVDLAETFANFLEERLVEVGRCILECPEDQFSTRFYDLCRRVMTDLTNICLDVCDGPPSLERMVQNRLEAISTDDLAAIRTWTMSAALGHVRTFIAGHARDSTGSLQRYIVNKNSAEALRKKEERAARLNRSREEVSMASDVAAATAPPETPSPQADPVQPMQDDNDTFVTPRSTPERMDVGESLINDVDAEPETSVPMTSGATASLPCPLPPPIVGTLPFPAELLPRGAMGPDMVVGGEPWHRSLPADWVPIIARDIQRQADQQQQTPFSDGYLSTQPSKRRRLIAAEKPEGPVDRVIAETLQDAIAEARVEPSTSTNELLKEATASSSLLDAVQSETRKIAKKQFDKDPDFEQVSEKIPNAKSFARK